MWVIGGVGGENMTTLLGLALLDFGIWFSTQNQNRKQDHSVFLMWVTLFIWKLCQDTKRWYPPQTQGPIPATLQGHTVSLVNSRIYVFGTQSWFSVFIINLSWCLNWCLDWFDQVDWTCHRKSPQMIFMFLISVLWLAFCQTNKFSSWHRIIRYLK
jgi:hypothetical protein